VLTAGDLAPDFALSDQDGNEVHLRALRGRAVLVYFYPKASTPGCTMQACALRDARPDLGDTVVLGISPDSPKALTNFRAKQALNFDLLSDPDHAVAEAYGVWQEKRNYGKTYMGIVRSSFLVGADGTLLAVWYGVKPAQTPEVAVAVLRGLS
jgi:thioredoxin-dependent peroxiredoxin